ncbi:MAG: hypothetical protein DYH20_14135 [Gammaproteobacteria bacterium PRO9]|nr:hypothetical protein [Gammaproteobacteria bacterium PRO9]
MRLSGTISGLLLLKAVFVWLFILLLAIANGALREAILVPTLGDPAGLALSGILLSALIIAATYAALPWLNAYRRPQLLGIGVGWLALTVVFEFCLGLWQGKSWSAILDAYTFEAGNLWPLVLLVTTAAPWLAARLRNWF